VERDIVERYFGHVISVFRQVAIGTEALRIAQRAVAASSQRVEGLSGVPGSCGSPAGLVEMRQLDRRMATRAEGDPRGPGRRESPSTRC
jgi:hypothetical protein